MNTPFHRTPHERTYAQMADRTQRDQREQTLAAAVRLLHSTDTTAAMLTTTYATHTHTHAHVCAFHTAVYARYAQPHKLQATVLSVLLCSALLCSLLSIPSDQTDGILGENAAVPNDPLNQAAAGIALQSCSGDAAGQTKFADGHLPSAALLDFFTSPPPSLPPLFLSLSSQYIPQI